MSDLKRTQLYNVHIQAGASMVDFGGWEMPIQYPTGIVAEHLYTRHACSLFDVSHMGRLLVEGPDRVKFLQHVLSSNVLALDLNQAQYCIIPDQDGGAVDDAYLYRFEENRFLLVVNAANTDKDLAHLNKILPDYNCSITNITGDVAAIAVQGPKSKELLTTLSGGVAVTEPPGTPSGWRPASPCTAMSWAPPPTAAPSPSSPSPWPGSPSASPTRRGITSAAGIWKSSPTPFSGS